MIEFEKKFFGVASRVGDYIAEKLREGGSWDFKIDAEDHGWYVTSLPIVGEWTTYAVDGDYKMQVPAGTEESVLLEYEKLKNLVCDGSKKYSDYKVKDEENKKVDKYAGPIYAPSAKAYK